MPYDVIIRKNETGEKRRIREDADWSYGQQFLWEEGNYSCDCNREIFFERANGVETEDEECSEGRFSANAVLPDGSEVSLDMDDL